MPIIRRISIIHQQGMDAVVPYVIGALNDVMDCFPEYKKYFSIQNLGNWKSNTAYTRHNGHLYLTPHESMDWYLERARRRSVAEGRWQITQQINIEQMTKDLQNNPYRHSIPQWGIYLTKYDLYGGMANNFCLGITRPECFCIISTNRFMNSRNGLDDFLTVVQHEFGHVIRLTEGNRPNFRQILGPHCTNPNCIMQQRVSGIVTDMTNERLRRKQAGLPPICPDCIKQGQQTFSRLYSDYIKNHPNNPNGANQPGNPGLERS